MSGTDHQKADRLTSLQRQWLARMQRFAHEGGTMVAHAAHHGLKLKQCYDWRCRLRKMGLLPSPNNWTTTHGHGGKDSLAQRRSD